MNKPYMQGVKLKYFGLNVDIIEIGKKNYLVCFSHTKN